MLVVAPTVPPAALKVVNWGLSKALSATVRVPVLAPRAEAVKEMLIVQLPAGGREAGQLFDWAKLPVAGVPVMLTFVTFKAAFPRFVSVTACAGVVAPVPTVPKFNVSGSRAAAGAVPFMSIFARTTAPVVLAPPTTGRVPYPVT